MHMHILCLIRIKMFIEKLCVYSTTKHLINSNFLDKFDLTDYICSFISINKINWDTTPHHITWIPFEIFNCAIWKIWFLRLGFLFSKPFKVKTSKWVRKTLNLKFCVFSREIMWNILLCKLFSKSFHVVCNWLYRTFKNESGDDRL